MGGRVLALALAVVALAAGVVGVPDAQADHAGSGQVCRLYWDDTYENYTDYPDAHSVEDCESQALASSAFDWAFVEGPPPTTTTTVVPPTTTTTQAPPSWACSNSEHRLMPEGMCGDPLHRGVASNAVPCNTVADGGFCSLTWVMDDQLTADWYYNRYANEWRLKRVGASIRPIAVQLENPSFSRRTGNMCGVRLDGSYFAFDMYTDSLAPITLGTNLHYIWRPAVPNLAQGGYPSAGSNGFYSQQAADEVCGPQDPGLPVTTAPSVPTPTIDCNRVFVDNGDGTLDVVVRAMVPSHAGATDEVTIRFPWEARERIGTSFRTRVPPDYAKPEGGWIGTCKVTRTVITQTHRGSDGWSNGSTLGRDVPKDRINDNIRIADDCHYDEDIIRCDYPDRAPDSSFLVPPSIIPSIPVILAPGVNPSTISLPIGPNVPTVAGVTAAGIAGWNLGGIVTTGLDKVWGGDDEWFCRWNPTYRALNGDCDHLINDRPYLRQETFLEDVYGQPVTTTTVGSRPWVVGTAVAQVLIDPARPELGRRTTTATEAPEMSPAEQTKIAQAVDEEAANDRVAAQGEPDAIPEDKKAPGDPETDPRPPHDQANPDPTPLAPPPDDGSGGDDCGDFSIWDWLNPFNLDEALTCILRKLFVPSGNAFQALRSAWSSGVGNLVGHPAKVLVASWDVFDQGGAADCNGPTFQIPGGPGWGGFEFRPLAACSGVPKTMADTIRPVLLAVIWLGCILACGKLIASAFGINPVGGGGDGD
jgi:hypothetical protein